MKFRRRLTIFLICVAVLMTLLSVLLISLAALSRQEMLHEGLTKSQWYESAIRSYRSWSLMAGITVLETLALWLAVLIRLRRASKTRKESALPR